jgi:hypothetical protein
MSDMVAQQWCLQQRFLLVGKGQGQSDGGGHMFKATEHAGHKTNSQITRVTLLPCHCCIKTLAVHAQHIFASRPLHRNYCHLLWFEALILGTAQTLKAQTRESRHLLQTAFATSSADPVELRQCHVDQTCIEQHGVAVPACFSRVLVAAVHCHVLCLASHDMGVQEPGLEPALSRWDFVND